MVFPSPLFLIVMLDSHQSFGGKFTNLWEQNYNLALLSILKLMDNLSGLYKLWKTC
ncbi:hypothetical protein RchiOBHm_Chr4g0424071 [Rosa chinensis]|uniref:Uncharacterized protein n=1 Tax=Rosa chinensis TaxID=74649 RepID=A0A2P6QZ00_ROSCH|nr:hypothetical protein RchiOBHm_Chr4g0424071 [Rosa chinensis]